MTKREPTEEEIHELLTNRFTAPFKAEVTGHRELTEEEKREAEEFWKNQTEEKIKISSDNMMLEVLFSTKEGAK